MKETIKIEYELINEMRKNKNTPVDTMGCHLFKDNSLDIQISNFHVIVGAFLSSQTQDSITYPTMERLKKWGLTIQNIIKIDEAGLAQLIKPVGFYNRKAKQLKKMCVTLRDEFNYKPPISLEKLLKLPGIGKKMAYLILNVINEIPHGICVDTHVHRITNRLGWVDTKNPEETRLELENCLPKNYWIDINPLLVGFGQTICKSRNPKCDKCLLKCKYYLDNKKNN